MNAPNRSVAARPTATVVIPVWNSWDFTAACLGTLRSTLGPRDTVVVVDNGSSDETATGLTRFTWLSVITNETNRGFATACNQGAATATGEVVVFLNNDTLVSGRWLDDLLEPFADTTVGATGPRSNFVSGPQLVDQVGYTLARRRELREWARSWRQQHRGSTTETGRLVGFCVAVRRSAFDDVGGWDEGFEIGGYEDDDLCARLSGAGWRLLIADASFVHHHGHATFDANELDWLAVQQTNQRRFVAKQTQRRDPLVAACILTKDEERNLPRCLESLAGVVDHVIVYDTGSTDRTVELAREAGATVVEGHWDDNFARARNDALAHCRATWVLSIDADEVLECDRDAFWATLAQAATADALQIGICNLEGTTTRHRESVEHQAFRLLRPDRACWEGRLHEQPVARPGQRDLRRAALPRVRLVHWGYLADVARELAKPDRNVRLAELELAELGDLGEADSVRVCNLGRSLLWTGRAVEALERFEQARRLAATDRESCQALRFGTDALLALARYDEATEWAEALRANAAAPPSLARFYLGMIHLGAGRPGQAFQQLEGLEEVEAEDGSVYPPGLVQAKRGLALFALERWVDAAAELRVAVGLCSEPVWGQLVYASHQGGDELSELAGQVDEETLPRAVAECALLDEVVTDRWLEALWRRWPGRGPVLAGVVRLRASLPAARAMEWSSRLRNAGLTDPCPLANRLADGTAPPADRVRAAAILVGAFGGAPDQTALADAASRLPSASFRATLLELDELAPELLPAVVGGAASNRSRSLELAELLTEWGAAEEAGTLLERAFGHRDLARAQRDLTGAEPGRCDAPPDLAEKKPLSALN